MFKTQAEMEAIVTAPPQCNCYESSDTELKTHTFAMTQRFNTNEKRMQSAFDPMCEFT